MATAPLCIRRGVSGIRGIPHLPFSASPVYVSERGRAYNGLSQSLPTFSATVASADTYFLGEGPVWDAERGRVLWVDIEDGHVHTGILEDGQVTPMERHDFDEAVGAAGCSAAGDLIVAGRRRIHYVDAAGGRRTGPQIISDETASRLNDGGCDPQGQFLVGSMATDGRHNEEVLVRVEDDSVTVLDDDLTLSNGLAWSADGRLMYSIDTIPGTLWMRDYQADGQTGLRRPFLEIADGGSPDGLCVDTSGNLWIAIWGAGQVRCYSPAGEHIATVEVAAPHTTSVAFAGPHLDRLLITTAREKLTDQQLADFPDSGRLFLADVGTVGVPVAPWRGH